MNFDKIEGADFNYHNSFFKFWKKMYPHKAFLEPILMFFVLHETLHFEKFEGDDFKYDYSSFSNSSQKIPR